VPSFAQPVRRVQHTLTYSSHNDAGETSTTSTIEQQQDTPAQPTPAAAVASASTNSNGASTSSNSKDDKDAPKHLHWVLDASDLAPLQFTALSGSAQAWTNFKLAFALPWRRFKPEAVLTFKLEGEISDKLQGRFSPGFSMPQILDALEKAAVDPRVKGIAVEISPLAVRC
jgi:protease-4